MATRKTLTKPTGAARPSPKVGKSVDKAPQKKNGRAALSPPVNVHTNDLAAAMGLTAQKLRRQSMSTVEERKRTPGESARAEATEDNARAQLSAGNLAGGGSVEKIRDILFGSQMRDYDKRFSRLEDRLLKEATEVREEAKKRLEALESYMKKEVEALTTRLKAEQEERTEMVKELTRELKDTTKTLEKRLAQLDEQEVKHERELRQQILDQSKVLTEDIRHKHQELAAALEREAQELRTDKTDRSALAALFTEVALRLTNEFRLPGAEDVGNA
jgi:chromosome segregation ATPase